MVCFAGKAAPWCAAFLLVACTTSGRMPEGDDARRLLAVSLPAAGFADVDTGSASERLRGLLLARAAADTLTVYIEGDGAAWLNAYNPPADPTPQEGIVARMALADAGRGEQAGSVAYLGRPCQYLDEVARRACPVDLWVGQRFSPNVLARMDAAVTALKHRARARQLKLVGYSGGGVIATLLAMRRDDVRELVTVAAPLDVGAWAAHHRLSPLSGSLDPATGVSSRLPPAVFYAGERDRIVPPGLLVNFAARTGARLARIPDFDHHCCWAREWVRLLEEKP